MIPKYILKEVLFYKEKYKDQIEITRLVPNKNYIEYTSEVTGNPYNYITHDKISVYELAHKCKEWAYSQGYIISSGLTPVLGVNKDGWAEVFSSSTPLDGKLHTFKQLSEPKAIFKACQWLLEQNKGKL
jgi:mevalonate pyrophosphate decarboxylase